MKAIECQVKEITSLTPFVYKVILTPTEKIDFIAGQYLNFIMAEDDKRPFSIASAPESHDIELQIGAFSEDGWAMQVIDRIKENRTVHIEMPLGTAHLRSDSERPLLLLAGGTGFSYIKSMFEHLIEINSTRPVMVYWGLREPSACYELAETQAKINSLPNGSFIPVVEQANDEWLGKIGLVHQVAMKDIVSFEPYDIYLAGRFDMVGNVRNDFVKQGASPEHMFADAFAFI